MKITIFQYCLLGHKYSGFAFLPGKIPREIDHLLSSIAKTPHVVTQLMLSQTYSEIQMKGFWMKIPIRTQMHTIYQKFRLYLGNSWKQSREEREERGLSGKSRPFLTANPGFLSFTPRDPGWNRYLQIIPRHLFLKSSSWDFPDYQSSTLNHYCIHQSFVGIVIYLKVILNINSIRSNITWRFIIQHNSGSFIPKYLRT